MKDSTLKKSKFTSDNENYNLKSKVLSEKKIDKDFLLASTKSLKGKLFNFPIFKYCKQICKEAVFKYALSTANNRKEASLILGIKKADMMKYIKEYNLKEEFYYGRRAKEDK